MSSFILRRTFVCLLVVAAMSLIVFCAIYALPGNVAYSILGQYATPADVAALEARLGLNDPVLVQYQRWLFKALQGDLGMSLSMGRPVGPLLLESLARSSVFLLASLPLIALLGIGLGAWAGANKDTLGDKSLTVAQYSFVAIPEFFWCIAAIIVFSGWLGWFPATAGVKLSEVGFKAWAWSLVLPVMTLVLGYIAHVSRQTRSSMIEVLESSYVLSARAKGLPRRRVIFRHALPNALLPAITVIALDVGSLIGGIVVVETIFSYPGIGWLLVYGLNHKDVSLILPAILLITAIYAVSNLVADILYAVLDPRIRFSGGAA